MENILGNACFDSRESFDSSGMILGVTGEKEKWQVCLEDMNLAFGFATGAMYVREHFHGDSKASVSNTRSIYLFPRPVFRPTLLRYIRLMALQIRLSVCL